MKWQLKVTETEEGGIRAGKKGAWIKGAGYTGKVPPAVKRKTRGERQGVKGRLLREVSGSRPKEVAEGGGGAETWKKRRKKSNIERDKKTPASLNKLGKGGRAIATGKGGRFSKEPRKNKKKKKKKKQGRQHHMRGGAREQKHQTKHNKPESGEKRDKKIPGQGGLGKKRD